MMILASLLSSTKYIIVNKDLIKTIGLHEAIIVGELCAEYTYWESQGQLVDNEYFYSTRENIEDNTGINAHYQRVAIKNLENNGIIESKRMGIPCKTYYKINENAVFDYLKKCKLKSECHDMHQVNDKKYPETLNKCLDVHEMNNKTFTECTTSQQIHKQLDNDVVDSINNNNNINNKEKEETKKLYATKVMMTEQEFKSLINQFGEKKTKELIENLSLYKQSTGKSYYSDYATIIKWEKKNEKDKENSTKINNTLPYRIKSNYDQRDYPPDFFEQFYINDS